MTDLKYVFGDPEVCTGCMICVNVCSMFYFKVLGPEWARNRVQRFDDGSDFPLFCRNCTDAPCMTACPEKAITRTSKGVVIVNNRKCTGCKDCVRACPYDAIHLNPDTGKAIKCIQCGECVKRCPVNAIEVTTEKELAQRESYQRLMGHYKKHWSEIYAGGDRK